MNIEMTKNYYDNLDPEVLCDCNYCKNYILLIKEEYPELENLLPSMGVDIEKPFETYPLEPENGKLEYSLVQYVVMGNKRKFESMKLNDINIKISTAYPSTGIKDEHFVIEIFPIKLTWDDRFES